MTYKILLLATLAAVSLAEKVSREHYDPDPYDKDRYDHDPYDDDRYDDDPYDDKGHHGGSSYHDSHNKKPDYNFHYRVKDKYYNDFGHWEERKGYVTKGWYDVVLPDYRRQEVHYIVDGKKGYKATVTYTPVKKDKHHKGGHGHGSYKGDPYKPDSYEDDPYKPGSYEHDPYKPYRPRPSYKPDSHEHRSYEPRPYY
ncbi:adhesive plaque matrix protein-like isoform X2 [Portunus trituberculatus]|uniref:adhesive plaque matrix protein-like isoform X2 n=1 Tax=Portunus trituberculatus TaxID=210409 RepID=UPI001E1D13F9|nr:adhesive plaque matrix protein-like isoform X2 [Portunus trituberculatus]